MPRRLTRHRSTPRNPAPSLRIEALEKRDLLAADVRISEFLAANEAGLLDGNGTTSDWIELHNAGDQSADLSGWHLTDDASDLAKWTFPSSPPVMLAPGGYLVVFASGDGIVDPSGNQHTDFSLAAGGEYLGLVQPDLTVVSEFAPQFPVQRADISYGTDASGDLRFFPNPTPGSANPVGLIGFVEDTRFSVDRGFYSVPISVEVTSDTLGATIIYTTDGSVPSLTNGTQVTAAADASPTATVMVTTTTTLRAVAYKSGFLETNVDTQSYLFLDGVLSQPTLPPGFPTVWGNAPSADYAMDPEISGDPSYTQVLLDGLSDLPTLSITSSIDDLFGVGGIYSNPLNSTLEIPASAEYLFADGTSGFQIDAGLKIAGGASRNPNNSPKHSLSLRFRNEYGDKNLDYDLFNGSPVDQFNSLQLRAVYNNSWIHWNNGQRSRGTLIRDQFIRDSLLAAGQGDAGRGSYAHVYLNGLYWGVFNLHERGDSSHYAEYNGGDSSDYDALNGGVAIDGTIDSFDMLRGAAQAGDWGYVKQNLDVDNFIDWAIAQAYGGNADLKVNGNWRASGGGPAAAPWRMYAWDSERVLEGVTAKPPESITDATGIYDNLIQIPEFVVRFGDRLQQHLFHDGVFTPDAAAARWIERVDELSSAIVAESARWGDYRRDVHPRGDTASLYERDVHWNNENERLVTDYFPGRTDFLISRYRQLGLLPAVSAPGYLIDGRPQSGGEVPADSELRITSNEGLIYYTTDGSDPRLEGGGVNPAAMTYDPVTIDNTLIGSDDVWKYHDLGIDPGNSWQQPAFDDSQWNSGNSPLGFGNGGEATVVSFGVDPNHKHITTYFRSNFDIGTVDPDTAYVLRVRRDDGIVLYVNGIELARNNMPGGSIVDSTRALAAAGDDGDEWLEFPIDPVLLVAGSNVIAAEVHQNSPSSSDLTFDAELIASTQQTNPLVLDESVSVRARVRSGGIWSAVHVGDFVVPQVPASTSNLRITEISYHPTSGGVEFIEVQNITSGSAGVNVNLGAVTLSEGPSAPFTFPVTATLGPQEHALIVGDLDAFFTAYPLVPADIVLGEFAGSLSNGGERIVLLDPEANTLLDFDYDDADPWPLWADGIGGTLVLSDPANSPAEQTGKPYHWRGSTLPGGSPGVIDASPRGVVINEVLAHTDSPAVDTIELHNTTTSSIDLGGWYLSDSKSDLLKFRIPDGTVIDAGGYVTFDESDFNPTPQAPGPKDFALSGSHGDAVWLVVGDGNGSEVKEFVDHIDFGATFNGVALGRAPNAIGRLVPMAALSLGGPNGEPGTSDVIVTEVNYHPSDPTSAALVIDPSLDAKDLEFIELHNRLASTVDLTNWRLRGESDFDFSAGDSIAGGETIVLVKFDPADPQRADRRSAFRTHYGIDADVRLIGPMSPSLSNNDGLVKLQRPDMAPADEPTVVPRVLVDEVYYDDLAPWPVTADGAGDSLQRAKIESLGNDPQSWRAAVPTPGTLRLVPRLQSVEINDGQPTRSVITQIDVTFDAPVDVAASAFQLTNVSTSTAVTGVSVSTVPSEPARVILTFTAGPSVIVRTVGDNSLASGVYELKIFSDQVIAVVGGAPLDEDVVFGDQAAEMFFRKFGDQNGDDLVNLLDFAGFRSAFGSDDGDTSFRDDLDVNGDGSISLIDFAAFRSAFGS